jgi:hypothetical protein
LLTLINTDINKKKVVINRAHIRALRMKALKKPILSKEGWWGPCDHKQQFSIRTVRRKMKLKREYCV